MCVPNIVWAVRSQHSLLPELYSIDRTHNESLLIPTHEVSLMSEEHIEAEKESFTWQPCST